MGNIVDNILKRNRIANIAAICVLSSLAAGGLTYLYVSGIDSPFPEDFLPEYVKRFTITNSLAQNQAYKVTLLTLMAVSAIGLFALILARPLGCLDGKPTIFQLAFVVALYFCTIYPGWLRLPTALFGYQPELLNNQILVLVSAVLLIGLTMAGRFAWWHRARHFLWAGVFLATLLIFGPELLSPIVVLGDVPIEIDWHYDSVLGPAGQIAAGMQSSGVIVPTYGVLWVSAIGLWEKLCGPLDFGGYIRLVQWSQLAFWLLVFVCFRLWRPNKYFALLACLMLLATYLTPQLSIAGFPNQTGLRSITFPLGVLALIICRQKSLPTASATLGLCWGIMLLINFETSVAVAIGFAVYLSLRAWSASTASVNSGAVFRWFTRTLASALKRLAGAGILFCCCAAFVVALYASLYRISFGLWPRELECYSGILRFAASGYIGLPFYLDPWALVIFVCAAWMLVSRGYKCVMGHFTNSAGIEAALAAMLLVWLQYYVNRPHPWQLWTHLFLFALMMSAYINTRYVALLMSRKHRMHALPSVALMTFIILPCILAKNSLMHPQEVRRAFSGLAAPAQSKIGDCIEVSGVYMSPEFAKRNLDLIGHLQSLESSDTQQSYLAVNGFLLAKETGPSALPNGIAFSLCSRERLQRLFEGIREKRPRTILIEASRPNGAGQSDPEVFWHLLAERVKDGIKSEYTLTGIQGGWEIWSKAR